MELLSYALAAYDSALSAWRAAGSQRAEERIMLGESHRDAVRKREIEKRERRAMQASCLMRALLYEKSATAALDVNLED